MATYLQGITDQVNVINPPQIDAQFEMQLLQARQSRYDKKHAEVSKLYSSILNSSLSRTDNKEARDEFFKLIEKDIKKIAQTDLSLESNAKNAENLFSQIYDNDYLVYDMVWTKNHKEQLGRAESFKNCAKPEDCGGMHWDQGVKYMQYKKEEFQNAERDESLSISQTEYIPYNNIMDEALKYAKLSEFEVIQDSLDGGYKIQTKNGALAAEPLQALFQGTIAKNPKIMDVYKVETYNKRNDWMRSEVQKGTYNTLNEARVGYLKENYDVNKKNFDKIYKKNNVAKEILEDKLKTYESLNEQGELTKDMAADYQITKTQIQNMTSLNNLLEDLNTANSYINKKDTQTNIESILKTYDGMEALSFLNRDLEIAAGTLANLQYSQTFKADEFALEKVRFNNKVALQRSQQSHAEKMIRLKAELGDGSPKNIQLVEQELSTIQTGQNEMLSNTKAFRITQALVKAGVVDKTNAVLKQEDIQRAIDNDELDDYIAKQGILPAAQALYEVELATLQTAQNKRADQLTTNYIALAEKFQQNKFTKADEEKLMNEEKGMSLAGYNAKNRNNILVVYKAVLGVTAYDELFKTKLKWIQ